MARRRGRHRRRSTRRSPRWRRPRPSSSCPRRYAGVVDGAARGRGRRDRGRLGADLVRRRRRRVAGSGSGAHRQQARRRRDCRRRSPTSSATALRPAAPGGPSAVHARGGAAVRRRPTPPCSKRAARRDPRSTSSPSPIGSVRAPRRPVRKLAKQLGVDLALVEATRRDGSDHPRGRRGLRRASRQSLRTGAAAAASALRRTAPGDGGRAHDAHPDPRGPQAHGRGDGAQRLHRAARHDLPHGRRHARRCELIASLRADRSLAGAPHRRHGRRGQGGVPRARRAPRA